MSEIQKFKLISNELPLYATTVADYKKKKNGMKYHNYFY